MIPSEALVKPARDRQFIRDPEQAPTEDFHGILFELEKEGEWEVQRVPEPYVEVETKYGRKKKIPLQQTWHHKSCGQCGHIPGYSTSIFWINRKLGFDYLDPTDQTSCTAWNYYASATSNAAAQAAVAMRNFAAAAETSYFPIIHCGTSFGHYKETRQQLIHSPVLRRQVRDILKRLGKKFVIPEEIVHYSEWVHAVRDKIAEQQTRDMSMIRATVHPACHYHKLIAEDAVYDAEIYGALDQSQFAAKAHNRNVGVPVMSDSQMAAQATGAHPYKVLQLHWHSRRRRNTKSTTSKALSPKF